ncbi:MAG: PAS domain-containing protein [Thermoleophilia bacterium]
MSQHTSHFATHPSVGPGPVWAGFACVCAPGGGVLRVQHVTASGNDPAGRPPVHPGDDILDRLRDAGVSGSALGALVSAAARGRPASVPVVLNGWSTLRLVVTPLTRDAVAITAVRRPMDDGDRANAGMHIGPRDAAPQPPVAWLDTVHADDRERLLRYLDGARRPGSGEHPGTDSVAPAGGPIRELMADVLLEFAWRHDGTAHLRSAGSLAAQILGVDPDTPEGLASVLEECLHPDDRRTLLRELERLRGRDDFARLTLRLDSGRVGERRVHLTLVAHPDPCGAPTVVGVLTDDRVRRDLEGRVWGIAETVESVVWEAQRDGDGAWSVTYLSPAVTRVMGVVPPADPAAAGALMLACVHEDDRALVLAAAEAALTATAPVHQEFRAVLPGGEVRRLRGTLVRSRARPDAARVVGVVTDITDMWDAEQRTRRVLRAVDAMVIEGRVAAGGRWEITHTEERLERLIGRGLPLQPADRGGVWLGSIHASDRAVVATAVDDAVTEDRPSSVEVRVVRPDGEVRWVRMLVAAAGEPGDGRFACVITDTTDARIAGERLRQVFDTLDAVVVEGEVRGMQWHTTYASAAVQPLLGQGLPDDPDARCVALDAAMHPDDRNALGIRVRNVMHRGGRFSMTVRVERADGETRWLRGSLTRRDHPPTRPVAVGVFADVTELVRTGQELTRATEQLDDQVAQVPPVIYEMRAGHDDTWSMTALNNAEDFLGVPLPPEPRARMLEWVSRIAPADLEQLQQATQRTIDTGEPCTVRYRLTTGRGERWVQASIGRIAPDRLAGMISDITAAMSAEHALQRAQAGLLRAIEGLAQAVFELHVPPEGSPELVFATPSLSRLFGLGGEPAGWGDLMGLVHPDDRDALAARVRATGDGLPLAAEFRVRLPDGTVRWLAATGRPRADMGDMTVRVAGAMNDITDERASRAAGRSGVMPSRHPERAPRRVRLTARQLDVLALLARGATTEEIAEQLEITRTTVANHVAGVLRRLDARSRLEAVHIARSAGLLDPAE